MKASHGAALDEATQVEDKLERQDACKAVEGAILEQYGPAAPEGAGEEALKAAKEGRAAAQLAFDKLEKSIIRERIASTRSAPTVARRMRSAISRSKSASRRARTARPCSHAGKHRP